MLTVIRKQAAPRYTIFSDLVKGDLFRYRDCVDRYNVYIKVDQHELRAPNAVLLPTGSWYEIKGSAVVVKQDAELVTADVQP